MTWSLKDDAFLAYARYDTDREPLALSQALEEAAYTGDIHIEAFGRRGRRTVHGTRYAVLCGDYVIEQHLVVPLPNQPWGRKPTCLGCILVHFQNLAEDA